MMRLLQLLACFVSVLCDSLCPVTAAFLGGTPAAAKTFIIIATHHNREEQAAFTACPSPPLTR